jgi:hypothetical protein
MILLSFFYEQLVNRISRDRARHSQGVVLDLCDAHLVSLTSWQSRLDLGRSVRLAIAFAITPGLPA